jgi:hypothetical protein
MVDMQLDECLRDLERNSARFTCVKCGSDNMVQVVDLKKYIGDDLFKEIDALERELIDEARLLRQLEAQLSSQLEAQLSSQLEAQLSSSPMTSRSETVGFDVSPEPHPTLTSPPNRVVTRSRSRTCPPEIARTRSNGRSWDIMDDLVV